MASPRPPVPQVAAETHSLTTDRLLPFRKGACVPRLSSLILYLRLDYVQKQQVFCKEILEAMSL